MVDKNGKVTARCAGTVTITAKEKICVLDKPDCNPFACPRAKGHFDRVNEALFASENIIVLILIL